MDTRAGWRGSPLRILGLACLAPELAAGLRTARGAGRRGSRSLTCDVSDSVATSSVRFTPDKLAKQTPQVCREDGRRQLLEASTNCTIAEGPWEFRKETQTYWTSRACPLTSEGLRRASTPLGHGGARLRLRRALERLAKGVPLYITVLGGSMTAGHRSLRAWPDRLQDLLRHVELPVAVSNRAQGGTTSRWVLANWNSLAQELESSDLILVDYGINDQGRNGDFRTLDGLGDQVVTGVYKDMLKMLLGLPNRPAVVDIETFKKLNVMTMARLNESVGSRTLTQMACRDWEIDAFRHWQVNKEMDIPTISYPEAVCASGRTYWMREGTNEKDENELQHPGSVTHDLFARVVRGVLLQELEEVCSSGAHGSEYPMDLAGKVGSHIKCLAKPKSYYDARHGVEAFTPLRGGGGAWSFEEDVPGKPGWIAAGGSVSASGNPLTHTGGQISFDVVTESGWIQVEFLGTYQNIGFVSAWLDDEEPTDENSCRLDGLWVDHTSQSRYSLMKTQLAPGRHTLNFRAYGMKFKLLGIATC